MANALNSSMDTKFQQESHSNGRTVLKRLSPQPRHTHGVDRFLRRRPVDPSTDAPCVATRSSSLPTNGASYEPKITIPTFVAIGMHIERCPYNQVHILRVREAQNHIAISVALRQVCFTCGLEKFHKPNRSPQNNKTILETTTAPYQDPITASNYDMRIMGS